MRLTYRTRWKHVLLVCRKCGKRQRGGFGDKGRDSLKSVLRQSVRDTGRRRDIRVLETSCLGICPKRGVTALNAARPGALRVIPAGTPAGDALDALLRDDPAQSVGIEPAGLPLP
jgi:predicted metal-binding protein